MKIYALCDIDSLKVASDYKINFENWVNFVYKQSEVGAKGVVLYGKSKKALSAVFEYLKDRLDIPVFIYGEGIVVKSVRLAYKKDDLCSLRDLKLKDKVQIVLVRNSEILRHFASEKSNLPELISVITAVAFRKGARVLITEETQSAVKALSAIKKLS
ncbi:MAG: hypothetical protein ACP5SB_03075 [Caldisericaceae bacterium]